MVRLISGFPQTPWTVIRPPFGLSQPADYIPKTTPISVTSNKCLPSFSIALWAVLVADHFCLRHICLWGLGDSYAQLLFWFSDMYTRKQIENSWSWTTKKGCWCWSMLIIYFCQSITAEMTATNSMHPTSKLFSVKWNTLFLFSFTLNWKRTHASATKTIKGLHCWALLD